jgi:PTS system mannitol-specific IIC component
MGKSSARRWRVSGSLAGMVVPSLPAVLAWGVVAAILVPGGWLPSEKLAPLVGPTLRYLLPLLLGYAGGARVHGLRGGVVGAAAAMGLAVGAEVPMLVGAMLVGPLGGWLSRRLDQALSAGLPDRLARSGSEAGAALLAAAVLVAADLVAGPAARALGIASLAAAGALVSHRLFPLAELVLAPARILFLDDAVQQRLLFRAGIAEVATAGRAIHFLLSTNPGPALGLLAAFAVSGQGPLRRAAPVAAVVEALGGIQAISFFFVLAHPVMLLSVWAGGIASDTLFAALGAGLYGTPSPASLQATLALSPPGLVARVLAGVLVGAAVSFGVGAVILRRFPVPGGAPGAEGPEHLAGA